MDSEDYTLIYFSDPEFDAQLSAVLRWLLDESDTETFKPGQQLTFDDIEAILEEENDTRP